MKYFTPDLYRRLQPSSDPSTVDQALMDWDQAENDYSVSLTGFRNRLPAGATSLLDHIRLHDAERIDGWQSTDRFVLLVRMESPSQGLVELTYSLEDDPQLIDDALPAEFANDPPLWLHDEFSVENSLKPVFTHSILFADGRELRIRFVDLQVRQYATFFAAPKGASLTTSAP